MQHFFLFFHLFLNPSNTFSFDYLHNITDTVFWWNDEKDVDMICAYMLFEHFYLFVFAYEFCNSSDFFLYVFAFKYFSLTLMSEHGVIFTIIERMTLCSYISSWYNRGFV